MALSILDPMQLGLQTVNGRVFVPSMPYIHEEERDSGGTVQVQRDFALDGYAAVPGGDTIFSWAPPSGDRDPSSLTPHTLPDGTKGFLLPPGANFSGHANSGDEGFGAGLLSMVNNPVTLSALTFGGLNSAGMLPGATSAAGEAALTGINETLAAGAPDLGLGLEGENALFNINETLAAGAPDLGLNLGMPPAVLPNMTPLPMVPGATMPPAGTSGPVFPVSPSSFAPVAAAGAAGGATGGMTLSSLLGATGAAGAAIDAFGRAIPGLIGAYAAGEQGDAIRDIAASARADRAPFLSRSLEYLNDPTAYAEGPGKATLDGVLRRLSATHGNPVNSPTALTIATDAGLRDWRNAVTGFGNLGLSGEDVRLELQATGADAGVWGGLGDAASSAFTPRTSLADLLKQLPKFGLA